MCWKTNILIDEKMKLNLQVVTKDNVIHNVWKYVNQEGQESIWCKTWYGHHIIGIDCEWYCAVEQEIININKINTMKKNIIDFKGQCKGVRLIQRGIKDNHISVQILTEDDGTWDETGHMSSYWIDELIAKLCEARDYMKTQEPDMWNGKQYGYRFK